MCDEMAHEVDSHAALRFDGGADDTLLQLATTARVLRSSICMARDNCFIHVPELAKGVDHHVQSLAATAAIEKSFPQSHCSALYQA